jgi:archaellum component FlaC
MELMTWSDGKLEERLERIDERFTQVDRRFEQVDKRFEQVDKRFNRIEGDMRELKQGNAALQATLNRFIIGAASGWVVLMGTIFAKGF